MNRFEAKRILVRQLKRVRGRSYGELRGLIDEPENFEVRAPSGSEYQFEISACWDDRPDGDLRIFVSIDDGGWRASCPLTSSFILSPDGSFVGE